MGATRLNRLVIILLAALIVLTFACNAFGQSDPVLQLERMGKARSNFYYRSLWRYLHGNNNQRRQFWELASAELSREERRFLEFLYSVYPKEFEYEKPAVVDIGPGRIVTRSRIRYWDGGMMMYLCEKTYWRLEKDNLYFSRAGVRCGD